MKLPATRYSYSYRRIPVSIAALGIGFFWTVWSADGYAYAWPVSLGFTLTASAAFTAAFGSPIGDRNWTRSVCALGKGLTTVIAILATVPVPTAQILVICEFLYWSSRAVPERYSSRTTGIALATIIVWLAAIPAYAYGTAIDPRTSLLVIGTAFLFAVLDAAFRRTQRANYEQNSEIRRQNAIIEELIDANEAFQRHVRKVYQDSVEDERRRLSRDLHDGVMYSLTAIRIVLTNALDLTDHDQSKLRTLISQARERSQSCIDETRRALYAMRVMPNVIPSGILAVKRATDDFQKATGIRVETQFRNARLSYGEEVDSFIQTSVQEALTNTFRHGKADRVTVSFWEEPDTLQLTITDSSVGLGEFKKGIGLSGMEERAVALGGTMSAQATRAGFVVQVRVPVRSKGTS